MNFNQTIANTANEPQKKIYEAPAIEISVISMESNFAAGSVVAINVGGEQGTPTVTDWEDRQTEQIWNF